MWLEYKVWSRVKTGKPSKVVLFNTSISIGGHDESLYPKSNRTLRNGFQQEGAMPRSIYIQTKS